MFQKAKKSKATIYIIWLFFTAIVSASVSVIVLNIFISNLPNLDLQLQNDLYRRMMAKKEIEIEDQALRQFLVETENLEIYRQSIINKLDLIDDYDKKYYTLKELEKEIEEKRNKELR